MGQVFMPVHVYILSTVSCSVVSDNVHVTLFTTVYFYNSDHRLIPESFRLKCK